MAAPGGKRPLGGRGGVVVLTSVLMALSYSAVTPGFAFGASTFVVNSVGDAADLTLADNKCDTSAASGKQCTLRAAIQQANHDPGGDKITFNITSPGTTKVIAPTSPLPPITTTNLTIDGLTQSGASANSKAVGDNAVLKIVLDGNGAGASANGLELQGQGTLLRGLVIQRFHASGIFISGSANTVEGNFVGTNAAGTAARGNGTGIRVTGHSNALGGSVHAERSVISGNQSAGVYISGDPATDNYLENNYIGTTKSGTVALPNVTDGVSVQGAPSNHVGVAVSDGGGNVISGNGRDGVAVYSITGLSHITIVGNLIGTDATGSADLGNASHGVAVEAAGVTIGGTSAVDRNVISGNGADGVMIFGTKSLVEGNYIGTNSAGTAALANAAQGVDIVGGSGSHVGTTDPGAGNLISGNGANGVLVGGDSTTGNYVLDNTIQSNNFAGVRLIQGPNTVTGNIVRQNGHGGIEIVSAVQRVRLVGNQTYSNGNLGIDLLGGTEDSAGVTANDLDDPDTGANNLQNFPVLTAATRSASSKQTTVQGTLNSEHSTDFTIELFVVLADPSGHGEGQTPLSIKTITTDSSGDQSFSFTLPNLPAGSVLTATATSVVAGNTSEFALNRTVVAVP